MTALLPTVDGLLRSEGRFSIQARRVPWAPLLGLLLAGGFVYGAFMGLYGVRPLQALYSGIKVPLLLVVTSIVCLPNFFVVNTLLGLREDFSSAVRGVVAAQATMAVVLVSLAPLTLWVYASTDDHDAAVVLNGVFFLFAALFGQVTLARHYEPLIRRNPRHRIGKGAWLTLYVFIAIQLAWTMRPYVGHPSMEVAFFREDAWSNAYVGLFRHVFGFLR